MKDKFAYKIEVSQYDIILSMVNLTGCNKYLELGSCTGLNMREARKYYDKRLLKFIGGEK